MSTNKKYIIDEEGKKRRVIEFRDGTYRVFNSEFDKLKKRILKLAVVPAVVIALVGGTVACGNDDKVSEEEALDAENNTQTEQEATEETNVKEYSDITVDEAEVMADKLVKDSNGQFTKEEAADFILFMDGKGRKVDENEKTTIEETMDTLDKFEMFTGYGDAGADIANGLAGLPVDRTHEIKNPAEYLCEEGTIDYDYITEFYKLNKNIQDNPTDQNAYLDTVEFIKDVTSLSGCDTQVDGIDVSDIVYTNAKCEIETKDMVNNYTLPVCVTAVDTNTIPESIESIDGEQGIKDMFEQGFTFMDENTYEPKDDHAQDEECNEAFQNGEITLLKVWKQYLSDYTSQNYTDYIYSSSVDTARTRKGC